jgi:signal transduction histidine kinase
VRSVSLGELAVPKHTRAAILLVEDEAIVAKDLEGSLSEMGYEVFAIADSSEQAIEFATTRRPDIVLMDIRIKGKQDGIQTAGTLKDRFQSTVIYLTAHADEMTIQRAKQTEPYGYLSKPVKSEELRSVIEIALYRRKLDDLREQAAQVQAVNAKNAVERAAELEQLNHALREISRERALAEERTRALNSMLEFRIEERTRDLELANKELEMFSYSVAHDLRAPLRAIDSLAQALVEDCSVALTPRCLDYVGRIQGSSSRMGMLIESLLGLSHLGRSHLSKQSVDLSLMATSILQTLATEHARAGVTLTVAEGQYAIGDPQILRIALENLLGNAWKYTSKTLDAKIEFGRLADTTGLEPTWFIRDNGVGFDVQHAGKLFGVFERLHAEADFPGLGIGLATVKRIIEKHGGRLWATAAPNQGASFFFTLGPKNEPRH